MNNAKRVLGSLRNWSPPQLVGARPVQDSTRIRPGLCLGYIREELPLCPVETSVPNYDAFTDLPTHVRLTGLHELIDT